MNANFVPSATTRDRSVRTRDRVDDLFVNILSLLTIPVNGAGQSKRNKVFVDRERPFSQKIVKHATTAHSHLLEAGPEEE